MRKIREAFCWIIEILKEYKVPYRVSGGFAARVYGSKRKLADIDFDTTDATLHKILPEVKNYKVYGPVRYKDKEWNCLALELKYKCQEIGLIGMNSTKIFDKPRKKWVKFNCNFKKSEEKIIYGRKVKVISKEDLINYKKKIKRKVDLQDIKNLSHKKLP